LTRSVGTAPHADVATRHTDHLSVILLLSAVISLGMDAWAGEALVIGQARVIDGDGAILNGKTPDRPSTSDAIQSRLVTAAGELSF
jgi:hypothetical protein